MELGQPLRRHTVIPTRHPVSAPEPAPSSPQPSFKPSTPTKPLPSQTPSEPAKVD